MHSSVSSQRAAGNHGAVSPRRLVSALRYCGRRHLAEDEASITAVHFSTQDLHLIFDDFQAYGHTLASKDAIESLVKGGDYPRSVEFGEDPQAFYFSGKYEVVAIETAIGLLRVSHQPTSNIGGGTGIYIEDKLVLTLKFEQPVVLGQCIDRVMSIHRFLSLVAGRKQSIESLSLSLADDPVEPPRLSRRLQPLRGLEHEHREAVLT